VCVCVVSAGAIRLADRLGGFEAVVDAWITLDVRRGLDYLS